MRLRFSFPVGETERHTVDCSFAQFWGNLTISVDCKPVIREWRVLPPRSLTREYRFTVGHTEAHEILIVKEQKRLYGGARPQICRVFIDGNPAGVYSS